MHVFFSLCTLSDLKNNRDRKGDDTMVRGGMLMISLILKSVKRGKVYEEGERV